MYARNNTINAFDKNIFLYKDSESKIKEEKSEEKSEKKSEELKEFINNTFTFIEEKSEGINNDLFAKYFDFLKPSALAKQLYETKDKKKNVLKEIKNRWSNLKGETKKMPQEEIENEKPNQILEIVNNILHFNKEIQ